MLKHVRIDERLIHGQVATVWVNLLGCDRIIVANDEAVKSEMIISALKIACPTAVKLSILSVNKAIINIKSGKYDNDKVFLICKNIADCKRLIEEDVPITEFNVGNLSHKEGQKKIKKSVSLTQKDIDDIHGLLEKGIVITARMIPAENDASIAAFL